MKTKNYFKVLGWILFVGSFLFLILSIIFSNMYNSAVVCCSCTGPSPEEITKRKFLDNLMHGSFDLGVFLGVLFILNCFIRVFKKRKQILITFKENGKIIKDYFTLLVSNKKEVIFENSNYKYECIPSEVIKIERKNRWLKFIISICFLVIIGYISYFCVKDRNPCENVFCDVSCVDLDLGWE